MDDPGLRRDNGNCGAACLYLPLLAILLLLGGCEDAWNNPYPAKDDNANIYYSSFAERPKHLDPARSYTSSEWAFISQIYEPPYQYHFLRRPYEVVPLTAAAMPQIRRLGPDGAELMDDDEAPAFTEYVIQIQPGIHYQPHPAFATDAQGKPLYTKDWQGLQQVHQLSDFDSTGTRELTADDYVYQIKRLGFAPLHSPIASLMKDYIVGLKEFASQLDQAYAKLQQQSGEEQPWMDLRQFDLEGVEVVDRYSYRIRLKGEYPQFIYWLSMNFFSPMPWEAERFYHLPGLRERNITLHWYPVGTGPYYLAENNPNLRMVLEKNPNFRGERYPLSGEATDAADGYLADSGRDMPFIDRAIYSLDKESIPRWNKFLQGYYDVSGIGSDSFDQAVQFGTGGEAELTDAMQEKGIELLTSVSTSIYYFGFNMLDDLVGGDSERARLLRQAISIALDYEEFISIFRNGRGKVAHGPLPPGIFGYREGVDGINPLVYRVDKGAPVRRSIEEARALLERAGYPNGRDPETGKPMILNFDTAATGPDSKALLSWYRKQFQKLGIELIFRTSDYNRFQEKMLKGTAQLFSWGWNADYPDPENFLFMLYGPHSRVKHHGENTANYSNPEFDRLFDRMKFLPNGEKRQQIIDQMIAIVRHDAPWVWGFYPVDFVLHHQWYRNAKPNLMANNTLKYKGIDTEARADLRQVWNKPVVWPVVLVIILLLLSLLPAIYLYRRHERSTAR
ncbi:MAG: ABC transporter substrate-binding protein [Pseudomonadota bacterium]